jgi:hypothetical protein
MNEGASGGRSVPVNFAAVVPRVFDQIGLALVFFCSFAQWIL